MTVTDPAGGFIPGVLQVGMDDSSASTPHYLPVNLYRIVQTALQTLHIDRQKPGDLGSPYTVDSVRLGQTINRGL